MHYMNDPAPDEDHPYVLVNLMQMGYKALKMQHDSPRMPHAHAADDSASDQASRVPNAHLLAMLQ